MPDKKHLYPLTYEALKDKMPPKDVKRETAAKHYWLFNIAMVLGAIGIFGAGWVLGLQNTNETTDRHITQNCERLWPENSDRQSKCIFEAVYITSPPYTFQGEAPVEIPQGE